MAIAAAALLVFHLALSALLVPGLLSPDLDGHNLVVGVLLIFIGLGSLASLSVIVGAVSSSGECARYGFALALAFVGFTLATGALFLTRIAGIESISMAAFLESIAILFLAWMNVRRSRRFG